MKKRLFIVSFVSAILILTFFPASFLNADPANLVTNGDFETGDFTGWSVVSGGTGSYSAISKYAVFKTFPDSGWAYIYQYIDNIANTDLVLNYRYNLVSFYGEHSFYETYLLLRFYKTGNNVGEISHEFTEVTGSWVASPNINILNEVTSDYDEIYMAVGVYDGTSSLQYDNLELWFDDISLTERSYPSSSNSETISEPQPWIRDHEMTCYQVWINEDNNFEFVFWWEYANNNWVKIYDMAGNEVFSIDMENGNARFVADLPDGMYTVKTFHDGFETPIQEFVIGKP